MNTSPASPSASRRTNFARSPPTSVANAADAVGLDDGHIAIRILSEDGVGALLVEDNGGGIDQSLLPRIFDPFFSTKDEVGTGIGLWVTKELVEKNGGRVLVTSDTTTPGADPALAPRLMRAPGFASNFL